MESPYDLYRKMNSQYFSDTVVSYKVELTEELFRYEMDKLSDNMKQDLFENFGGTEGPGPVVPCCRRPWKGLIEAEEAGQP